MADAVLEIGIEKLAQGGFNPDRVRFLVYGDSGAGKTTFAATWPNPLFLDIDDGLASVKHPVDRVFINDWDKLLDVFWFLADSEHPYDTIILDSLNEAQRLAMDKTLEEFPEIRRSYGSLPSMSDYGKALDDFDRMVRSFKALPLNVVLIAQTTSKQFEQDVIKPQLTGKQTANNITRMMDIVGYLYKVEGGAQGRILTFDAVDYVTKDRSAMLPVNIENPRHADLYRYWVSGVGNPEVESKSEDE